MATRPNILARRVLIIDDSGTTRPLIDSLLSFRADYEIVGHANDVGDALAMIQQMRPDLVTIDLRLPYIDGSRLLGMLRDFAPIHKIVISSRGSTSAIDRKLADLGATAFFDKDEIMSDPERFRAELDHIVSHAAKSAVSDRFAPSNVIQAAHRFPLPWDETQRLTALVATGSLNLDADARLDDLTQELARITAYPIAIITLIGVDEVWIKSAVGIERAVVARAESICAHTICQDGAFVVTDAHRHATFGHLSSVSGAPGIRTYIGVPIVSDAHICLGTICICDTRSREVGDADIAAVTDMARRASALLRPTADRHAA